MDIYQKILLQLCIDIYSILNEKNAYFYVVRLVHVLLVVQIAVFDGFGYCLVIRKEPMLQCPPSLPAMYICS